MSEVSQREFFEDKILAQRELFDEKIAALERRFDATISAIERATDKQALEYKRRLEELNHEKERLSLAKADTVSREIWDRFQAEYNAWKQSYEVRHAELVTRRDIEVFRNEYLEYKEETRRAVDLAKGQSKGLMMGWGIMITVLTIAANFAVAYLKR